MRSLVFTGFGPFGDVAFNPSWDCAQAAAEAAPSGGAAELLAVTVDAASDAARRWAADDTLLVHFGVAARREHVSLERFAHNWWQDLGDAAATRLLANGPTALESRLPLGAWAQALDGAADLPWRVSHDAGNYVCNATLYHSLLAAERYARCDAVFVHVPACDAELARAIGAAVGAFVGHG